jgi:uncharacterized protein
MSSPSSAGAVPVSPLNKKERISFLDAVRGIAVLGILIVNITAQGQSHFFYNHMNLNQPLTGPNLYSWIIEIGFFEGNMRGLFSILFGVSTILLITRLEISKGTKAAAYLYYRRIFWLLIFGCINAYVFLWPGDILYSYALCALVLFPFRNSSVKVLVLCIFIMLALDFFHSVRGMNHNQSIITNGERDESLERHNKKLTKKQEADLKIWEETVEKETPATMMRNGIKETVKVQSSNYGQLFVFYGKDLMLRQTIGFYYSWLDIMIFFFLGMVLYRSGFILGSQPLWLYWLIAFVGVILALLINYDVMKLEYNSRFNATTDFESFPYALYMVRRILQTMGYISILILLYRVVPLKRLFNLFSPVGQMALTNYLSQSVITSIIFYGFGLYGHFQRYELYGIMVLIWIFQVAFCNIWLKYFMFGPFEWVWRSLTYLKAQPFKKVKENIPAKTISGTVANL